MSCSSQRTLSNRIIQFTCNAVSTHLIHRRIFLFSHVAVWGRYCACEIFIANPIDWLYAACLEYFIFFSIDSSEARKQYDEYCLNHTNKNVCTWQNAYTDYDCPFGIFKLFLRICWIVPKKYLLLLDQTNLLHFRSSIDRPLNLPQYPGSNNHFSIPEENI